MFAAWSKVMRFCAVAGLCLAMLGCPAPDVLLALIVSPDTLDFGVNLNTLSFTVRKIFSERTLPPFAIEANQPWISVNPTTGNSVGPDDPVTVTVTIDRTNLPGGENSGVVTVESPGIVARQVSINVSILLQTQFSVDRTEIFAGETVAFLDETTVAINEKPITSRTWNFGDGTTIVWNITDPVTPGDTDPQRMKPTHTYTQAGLYTVSLTTTTANATDTETKTNLIRVKPTALPTADFSFSPESPLANSPVQFTDLSTAGTAPITGWDWNFDDGSTSTDRNPVHVFTMGGLYQVVLTVTTAHGNASRSRLIVITAIGPTAAFSATPLQGNVLQVFQFTDESTPGTAPIDSWFWNFGDGKTSTGQN
ncbi:MAG: PKD domain-containing protein, partial [Candidatus Hydrogenedentes bacterium]|nr:PKD domain-containing protein [Candidatus Hydrogenedentota bacterium]